MENFMRRMLHMPLRTCLLYLLAGLPFTLVLAQTDTSLYTRYRTAVPIAVADLPNAQRPAALVAITAFIQQNPNYPLAYAEQASLALQTERSSLLQRSLQQLERLKHPAQPAVYLSGAALAYHQKRYPLALKLLQQHQQVHGESEALLLQQATVYRALNNATEGLKTLQKAQQRAPKSPAVLYALAQYYQSTNPRQSTLLYQQLLSYADYRPVALAALGGLYWDLYQADPGPKNRPNLERAEQYYRQYAQLRPKDLRVAHLLEQFELLLKD